MSLKRSIQYIKGIGPKKAETLKSEAGIITIEDLLYYRPRRYVDRSSFKLIKDCFVNDTVTVYGVIRKVKISGRRKRFLEVEIDDGSDSLTGVFFGGVRYFERVFKIGDHVLFSGRIDFYRKKQIVHPDFDFMDHDYAIKSIHTGRIVPLYPSTEKLRGIGFDSRGFRRVIRSALEAYMEYLEEPFDSSFLARLKLLPLKDAILSIHFPDTEEKAEQARKRLSFNELFFLQYYLSISKKHLRDEQGKEKRVISLAAYSEFLSHIPFELIGDQKKAIDEIKAELEKPYPMNRLLQGDVGSGKTVVAIAASLFAIGRGDQVALMAPTEVLAYQHFETFNRISPPSVKISLLTGSMSKTDKESIYGAIADGDIDIAIGTHALIQDSVSFQNLGLVIIDEQHRFGVNQRAQLRGKGHSPDLLVMTATPIPRSLSLTLYGDMDISYIREKPGNRPPIDTIALPESRIKGIYNSLEKYINQGRQIFYVLPLIEESEKSDLKSAVETHSYLKEKVYPHRNVELLHGKMNNVDKESIMQRFHEGLIDILVTTTVVEVGIDVPNANVIIIEHPERFGLSQLHQLRGRIGRGEHQSFCILIYSDTISEESMRRIQIITETNDGFIIAEEDLRYRGAGEIIGQRQHGHSGFEFVNLSSDLDLIMTAKGEAEKMVNKIDRIHDKISELEDTIESSSLLQGIRTKRILSILS
jgi:ATP-dependent DNA helicase RecG